MLLNNNDLIKRILHIDTSRSKFSFCRVFSGLVFFFVMLRRDLLHQHNQNIYIITFQMSFFEHLSIVLSSFGAALFDENIDDAGDDESQT